MTGGPDNRRDTQWDFDGSATIPASNDNPDGEILDSQRLPASADDSSSPSHVQTDRRQIAEEELPDGVNGPEELIRTEADIDYDTPDDRENVLCGRNQGLGDRLEGLGDRLGVFLYTWEFDRNQNNNWVVTERVHKTTLLTRVVWICYIICLCVFFLLPVGGVGFFYSGMSLAVFFTDFVVLFALFPVSYGIIVNLNYNLSHPLSQLEYGHRISINEAPQARLLTAVKLSLWVAFFALAGFIFLPYQLLSNQATFFVLTISCIPALVLLSQILDIYHFRVPLLSDKIANILTIIDNPLVASSSVSKHYLQQALISFVISILMFLNILLFERLVGGFDIFALTRATEFTQDIIFVTLLISGGVFFLYMFRMISWSTEIKNAEGPLLWKRNVNIRETSTRRQLCRLALSVAVCYIGTYSFVWNLNWLVSNISTITSARPLFILLYLGLLIGLLPPLYIYAGICYQIGQTVTDTFQKWQSVRTGERLSEKDPEWNDDRIHSPVIVHGSRFDPKNAAAVQLFGTNYILLTKSLYYDLQSDPDRLAAILSHEQSHIEHTDTLVSSVVSVVAPVLLLSEAAVYAMCDYKSREYRADLWALDQDGLSHEDLRDALDRAQKSPGKKLLGGGGVAATPVKFSEAGSRWRFFLQYFFSPYSVAVHPSLKNRKRTIDPNRERPPEAKGIQPE